MNAWGSSIKYRYLREQLQFTCPKTWQFVFNLPQTLSKSNWLLTVRLAYDPAVWHTAPQYLQNTTSIFLNIFLSIMLMLWTILNTGPIKTLLLNDSMYLDVIK